MIKRMTMLARREDRSLDAFRRHWLHEHVKIVTRMPHLHGYVQNHLVDRLIAEIGEPHFSIDGIPELWFVDEASKNAALQSSAAKELPVDEKNFIRGITIFAVDEQVTKAGQGEAKVMAVGRSGASGDRPRRWTEMLAALPGVRRAAVNTVLTADHRPGVWHEPVPPDAIVELRFDSQADARRAFDGFASGDDAHRLAQQGGALAVYLIDEKPIVPLPA